MYDLLFWYLPNRKLDDHLYESQPSFLYGSWLGMWLLGLWIVDIEKCTDMSDIDTVSN